MSTFINILFQSPASPFVLFGLFSLSMGVATWALHRGMRPNAGPFGTNSEIPMLLAFGLAAVDASLMIAICHS